jgi:hypothetical protein
MNVLHSTEFKEYITDLDPRFTYLTNRSVVEKPSSAEIKPLNITGTGINVLVNGDIQVSPARPKVYFSWTIEVLSSTLVRTTAFHDGTILESSVTFADNISSQIPLSGQVNTFIRIVNSSAPVGAKWLLSGYVPPVGDLTDVIQRLENISADSLSRLFSKEEPYKTFEELWRKHVLLQYRLSGFLLAYIYRVKEFRLNG